MNGHHIKELLHDNTAFQAILDGIGNAVSIQDVDFKVLFQNKAHENIHGGHVGEYCYKVFRHRNDVCEGCPVFMAFQDGDVHSEVRQCITPQGVIYAETTASLIKDSEGRIVAGIKVARDVTDSMKVEKSLSEAKQLLEDVTQGITESILLLSADYKILWVNKTTLQQTGLEEGELVGAYCYKATHGSDTHCESPDNPCPVRELLEKGEPVTTVHQHHGKNDNVVYAEVSAYPIEGNDGKIVRFVHVSKDITERVKLEKEREKLIRELQTALAEIKTLKGIIPICCSCKKIRNDSGYWEQIESYMSQHLNAEFTHGICPHCVKKLYSDVVKEDPR